MKRRDFVQTSLVGMAVAALPAPIGSATGPDRKEKKRSSDRIHGIHETGVLVCGGGSAGCAAAITAARKGVSVLLLEQQGALGGNLTVGLVNCILDSANKTGFVKEFENIMGNRNGRSESRIDPELAKLILEEMCESSGVKLRYHTRITDAVIDKNKCLNQVITESKAGKEIWHAKTFIDSTGDGDLSVLAGCGFDMGEPGTGKTQAMSFLVYLSGVGPLDNLIPPEVRNDWNKSKGWLYDEIKRGGYEPSYAFPTFYVVSDNLTVLMANHEYNFNPLDPDQITTATIRARRETAKMVSALRSNGGRWKNIHIVATPGYIGVREGRRIHGRYMVSAEDLAGGARHDDAVCRATFNVDIHSPDPGKTKGIVAHSFKTKPYDIPLRALIAKDVDGLMMAGRNISGDFWAHGSYRVIGNTMTMGEAAGLVSARAAATNRLPHEVFWKEVKQDMK